ncbi:MAG: hypothetical protein AVDCRST_MAG70-33, partial [uncultured Thermomicrobiales bacterium]
GGRGRDPKGVVGDAPVGARRPGSTEAGVGSARPLPDQAVRRRRGRDSARDARGRLAYDGPRDHLLFVPSVGAAGSVLSV